jgi:hypothetical protein
LLAAIAVAHRTWRQRRVPPRPAVRRAEALGDRAPVAALPDGGDDTYRHDRDSGDRGRSVIAGVIPQVAAAAARPRPAFAHALEIVGADAARELRRC